MDERLAKLWVHMHTAYFLLSLFSLFALRLLFTFICFRCDCRFFQGLSRALQELWTLRLFSCVLNLLLESLTSILYFLISSFNVTAKYTYLPFA